jgi:uncharacterized protein involved in exopolysaccharide biosynthesis
MPQEITATGSFYPAYPLQPESKESRDATKQLFFAIFKWQRLILGFFLAFTVAAAVAMFLKPPVRTATAKILLKTDRMPLQISGLSNLTGRMLYSPQVLQSEVEMIKSRDVLLPVAKKLLIAQGKTEKELTPEDIESKILALAINTVPAALPDTNVIQVTHFAPSAEEAENILRMMLDEYLDQEGAIQSGSAKLIMFYEQEKERAGSDLRAAEEQFKKWQESTNILSSDQQILNHLSLLAEREGALQRSAAEMEATKAKITSLRNQLYAQPERSVTSREQVRNPLITKLKTDLVTAELAVQDLLQRLTEKDRRVQEKREQIALIKTELAAAEKEGDVIGAETTALNPLREILQKELAAAQALLTSQVSQLEALRKQVREATSALNPLRDKKVEGDRLARVVELQKDAFMLYGKKLEEARIGAGLGKEQLANVAVIEKPHALLGTDLLKRILMVIAAALLGTVLGITIAFGLEFLNNSFRTQDDVEHYLGVPVLAAIPALRDHPLAAEGLAAQ